MTNKALYEKALKLWGVDSQFNQAIEEMAELIVAINHYRRTGGKDKQFQVMMEMVDVKIMLEQLKLILSENQDCSAHEFQLYKRIKLDRLAKRITEAEKYKRGEHCEQG